MGARKLEQRDGRVMMYIHMTFSKKTTPLHLPIQNILLAPNPLFLQKASGTGKNVLKM